VLCDPGIGGTAHSEAAQIADKWERDGKVTGGHWRQGRFPEERPVQRKTFRRTNA
jgi:hypothetical protein